MISASADFLTGSGAQAWYDGALLAQRGRMVVVTVKGVEQHTNEKSR